jgi:hypothetical protein
MRWQKTNMQEHILDDIGNSNAAVPTTAPNNHQRAAASQRDNGTSMQHPASQQPSTTLGQHAWQLAGNT